MTDKANPNDLYIRVGVPEDIDEIISEHLQQGRIVERLRID